jgi:ribulose-5-phosphate 4-epimerase/fuculose-1-phosphate aldolase
MDAVEQLRSKIVSACKMLSKQKLVEGFGHVSARMPDSD